MIVSKMPLETYPHKSDNKVMLEVFHYKKLISLLILLIMPLGSSEASPKTLLHCLAQEELQIHRSKTSGPLTELNQTLVNEIVSIGNIELKPEFFGQICSDKPPFTPSLKFLHVALTYGERIFEQSRDKNDPLEGLKDASIKGFMNDVPHIFFKYLSALQGLSSYSQCLFTQIPELKFFLERFHYLEEDFPVKKLLEDKDKIERIFKGLTKLNAIYAECEGLQKSIKSNSPAKIEN